MPRLKTLKPRVQTLKTERITTSADSWRSGRTTAERGYGGRWQRARVRFLRNNPICAYCEHEDRVTEASVVDHKIPHRGNQQLFWDESNWQSLCKPCHDSVKKTEESAGS